MNAVRSFFVRCPEILWALFALILWWLSGLALEGVTATYGLEFVQKAVITLCRLAFAVAMTELTVSMVFPSIRRWIKEGGYSSCFEGKEISPETRLRIILATVVHCVIFSAVMVSLSL